MMSQRVLVSGKAAVLAMAAVLVLAGLAFADKADSADVGMVTQVAGKATYSDALDESKHIPVAAFMKIRENDKIRLAAGASVRLVFFAGGSQENWTGPAVLSVGKDAAKPEGGTAGPRVEVTKLPMQVAEVMQTAPMAATRDNISKGGFVNVRAPKIKALPYDDAGKAKVAAAREAYAKMRSEAGADDVYPDLFLTAIMSKYALYDEMTVLVNERLKERPKNEGLKQLKARIVAMSKEQ